MNTKNIVIWVAMIGLMGISLNQSVNAYTTNGRWSGNNITLSASGVSFPAGNAYRTALGTVVSRWNVNPSNFWFTQTYDDPSVGFGNGQSEVWFSADSAKCSPAVTYWWKNSSGNIVEADVCFYNGAPYTTSMNKTSLWTYGGSYRPFETTAMHEYGHVIGLGHEANEYNIMGQDWTHISLNNQTARSYAGEDASDGAVSLYGLWGSASNDVGVVHMKWVGSSGQYSSHGITKMYGISGAELPWTMYNGQRRYNVLKGQYVKVEFTYENNGKSSVTPNIGFYTSFNSLITTADSRFATTNVTVSRANVYTVSTGMYIPSNLTSGTTYYLGAIADWNNLLAEHTEANNAAYHIIYVQ